MEQQLSRLLTASALVVLTGVLSVSACTHSTDRVVEPVGGGDASTKSPELADASVDPIGPIAHPIEPEEDFRLVRAPEFGIGRKTELVSLHVERQAGIGGLDSGGGGAVSGLDQRPVAYGGSY